MQVEALDGVAKRDKRSRASLIRQSVIRQAVEDYLANHAVAPLDEAVGIRRDRKVDGLDDQRWLRNEW